MARQLVSNFGVDCGEGSGCGVVVVKEGNAVAKAIFICSSGEMQVGVFSPIGDFELETEGSTTVVFGCTDLDLESLAEALDRIHPQSIGIGQSKEQERGEKMNIAHMTGTLDEVIDDLGLERG